MALKPSHNSFGPLPTKNYPFIFWSIARLTPFFLFCIGIRLYYSHKMAEKEGFNEVLIEPLKQFAKDSVHLVKKCTKPDRKQFTAIAKATGIGFLIMGFIGFFVKLIHIPINNILVGN